MVDPVRLRNRRGESVDAVPFLVTTGLAFALVFSFGPLYGLAYGLSLSVALVLSAAAFGVAAWVAYRQLVRCAPPVDAGPLPSGPRFERLLYAGIGLGLAFLALTLPLL
ncbi:hypothetical protein C464_15760 [Halorubrum coriense DSM 10284]|uniref:Uncharacterized protein n=1 Tax=Halorubrum coriense DSM 10284 TaxID=1227466 RepID=M0EB70_9EURY|nr:hypothetical protein [Halorubrum coriense]ELZ44303.1 hypothetical protein C464_15760 [Halorubrum coriense DSM 10284]